MHTQRTLICHSIINHLKAKYHSLSIAESCTGGLVCEWLTRVPGASKVFTGGVVAYSDEIKERILGVRKEIIVAHGAVSEEVANAMASQVRIVFGTTYGVSTTGFAGPEGGTHAAPVGTVFVGLAQAKTSGVTRASYEKVPRQRVRELAAMQALMWLERELG